jgi:hypothetical protein
VIDVAIWPRLVRDGTTQITRAPDAELCRRMSLDFVGTIPSPAELAACAGKTPEQMARTFMATPAFVAREVRLWVQTLGEDPTKMSGYLLKSGDAILSSLASGTLGYDDFVAKIVAHPIVTLNRHVDNTEDLGDVATAAFTVFLGRAPVGDEATDFGHLFHVWQRGAMADPKGVIGYRPFLAAFNPKVCNDPVFGAEACTSHALGAVTTINLPDNPAGSGCYNYFNLGDHGGVAAAPDGLLCFDSVGAPGAPSAVDAQGNLPPALKQELEKPGRLLAAQSELWEQAGELGLMRLLGWWKSSLNQPDTVVPEVRTALGAWFRAQPKHDIRDLYATIASSLLYTRTELVDPSQSAATDGIAPWLSGPTKEMTGEQYLDSAIKGLQRNGTVAENGPCDAHVSSYGAPLGYPYLYPAGLRISSDVNANDFYRANATALGACQGGAPSEAGPGIRGLFQQVGIGQTLCDAKATLVPPGTDLTSTSDATLDGLISFQFAQLFQRAPEQSEHDAARALAKDCLGDTTCGGTKGYAALLCQTLLRSSAFVFY